MSNTDLKQAAVQGGIWGALSRLIRVGCQLGSIIFLSRLLTPEDFGVVATVASLVTVVNLLRELGLAHAIVQRKNIEEKDLDCLFRFTCVLGAVLFVISVLLGLGAAWFFERQELAWIAPFYGFAAVLSSVEVIPLGLLRRELEFQKIAIREVFAGVLATGISIVIAWVGGGYWAIVVAPVVMQGTNVVFSWHAVPWRPHRSTASFRSISSYLRFGATMTLGQFANFLSMNLDRLIIGKVWGFTELGFYTRSHLLISAPTDIIASPVNATLLPLLTRMDNDPERKKRWIKHCYGAILILAGTLAGALYATVPDLVSILMGPGWEKVIPVVMGLTPFLFMKPAGGVLYSVLIGSGKLRALLTWTWVGTMITVTTILATVFFGLYSLVLGLSASLFIRMLLSIYLVNRVLPQVATSLVFSLLGSLANFLICAYLFSLLAAFVKQSGGNIFMILLTVGSVTSFVLGFWIMISPACRNLVKLYSKKLMKTKKL